MRERDKDRWFTRTGTTRSRSYEAMMDKTENRVRGVCRHPVGQLSSWINGKLIEPATYGERNANARGNNHAEIGEISQWGV